MILQDGPVQRKIVGSRGRPVDTEGSARIGDVPVFVDARLQQGQIHIVPAVQRQVFYVLHGHQPAQRCVLGIHDGGFPSHDDLLCFRSHFENQVDHCLVGHLEGDALSSLRFEAGMFAFHFIVTHGQFRYPKGAVVTGLHDSRQAGVHVRNRHSGIRQHASGCVFGHTQDRPRRQLGDGGNRQQNQNCGENDARAQLFSIRIHVASSGKVA